MAYHFGTQMKKAMKQKPTKYGFVAFRPSPILERRLRQLSEKSGQSLSAIIKECVVAQIGALETASKEMAS